MRGSRLVALLLVLGVAAGVAERLWRPRMANTHVAVHDVAPVDLDAVEVVTQRADAPVHVDGLQPNEYFEAAGGYRRALLMPPPATVRTRLQIPAGATLQFVVGAVHDAGAGHDADPVRFAVRIDGEERFAREVNAFYSRHDRHWFEGSVDLRSLAGRTVDLELATTVPDGGEPRATPGWSDVRLVTERWIPRQPADPATPSLLVLVVDTLRADRLGCYGARPSPSPNLDALCRRGLVMEQHVAQAPWTMPSTATILSGLYPRQHGVVGGLWAWGEPPGVDADANWAFLAHEIPTFLDLAQRAGITTLAVSANPIVSRGTNMLRDLDLVEELPNTGSGPFWATAADVNSHFLDWIEDRRAHRFLAYLHYMDVHGPYRPPPDLRPELPAGLRKRVRNGNVEELRKWVRRTRGQLAPDELAYLRALYDAEIRAWDRELGRLLGRLDELGLLAHTNILVTADHGEEFQDHGMFGHTQLFDEVIRVPFILAGPAVSTPRRVESQSQGIDVFPTVAALLGLAPPSDLPGLDVRGPLPARPAVSETRFALGPDGKNVEMLSVRTPEAKLLHTPATDRSDVFDLRRDPHEHTPATADTPAGRTLQQALEAWGDATPEAAPPGGRDPHLFEKLRELGYTE